MKTASSLQMMRAPVALPRFPQKPAGAGNMHFSANGGQNNKQTGPADACVRPASLFGPAQPRGRLVMVLLKGVFRSMKGLSSPSMSQLKLMMCSYLDLPGLWPIAARVGPAGWWCCCVLLRPRLLLSSTPVQRQSAAPETMQKEFNRKQS